MKYFIIILALITTGCVTQQKCYEKFPPDTITVFHDTTLYRDTILYREIKGDTMYMERIIYLTDTFRYHIQPIYMQTTLCYAKAEITGERLKMRLVQRDSIFRFKLDSAILANRTVIVRTKIVKEPVPPNPFWKNGFFILSGILLFLLTFLVIRK